MNFKEQVRSNPYLMMMSGEHRKHAAMIIVEAGNEAVIMAGGKFRLGNGFANKVFRHYDYLRVEEILTAIDNGARAEYGIPRLVAPIMIFDWLNTYVRSKKNFNPKERRHIAKEIMAEQGLSLPPHEQIQLGR